MLHKPRRSCRRRWVFAPTLGLASLLSLSLVSSAQAQLSQTVTQQFFANWHADNLSLWANGQATGSNLSPVLVGPTWNFGPSTLGGFFDLQIPSIDFGLFSTPAVDLGKTGAEVTFGGSGKLGLEFTPWYNDGSLSLSYTGGVTVNYPRYPVTGSQVTVTASFAPGATSTFSTATPQFGLNIAADFYMTGYASTQGYAAGYQLWNANILPNNFSVGSPNPKPLGNFFSLNNAHDLDVLVNAVNPLPVGASAYIPDVSATGTYPNSDGSIDASQFGEFLSVDTDALSWISEFFPDGKDTLLKLLSNDVVIPGTDMELQWTIAKAYASLGIGFYGQYKLIPQPQLALNIYNQATGQLIATGANKVTFIMPSAGFTVTPVLTLDFRFRNRLSVAAQGTVGIDPFMVSLTGTFGSGDAAQTIDETVDPAAESWASPPGTVAPVVDSTFTLPMDPNLRTRGLGSVGVNAADLLDLTRTVYVNGTDHTTLQIDAFSADSDQDYATVQLFPEQGRTFLINDFSSIYATIVNPVNGLTYNVPIGFRDPSEVDLQIPKTVLFPGQTTITFGIETTNLQHQLRRGTYKILTNIYEQAPVLAGQFFTSTDLDAETTTNRIPADGADHKIYASARYVYYFYSLGDYRSTRAVLNTPDGPIVLPTDQTGNEGLTGSDSIGITIPAGIAAKYAGANLSIQLRNANLRVDANGNFLPPLLSTPALPIFVVAGVPSINKVIPGASDGVMTINDSPAYFDLIGQNFTRFTTVYTQNITGKNERDQLPVTYDSPTRLHVTAPQSVVQLIHAYQQLTPTVYASTPVIDVPSGGDQQPEVTSGGTSNGVGVKFSYARPTISGVRSPVLIRLADNSFRIYGSNLFREPKGSTKLTTEVDLNSKPLSASQIFPGGTGHIMASYIDVKIPSTDSNVQGIGHINLLLRNGRTDGAKTTLTVQNGAPNIVGLSSADVKVGPGLETVLNIPGGPFYPESTVSLNGRSIGSLAHLSLTSIQAKLQFPDLRGIQAQTANLNVVTPAPGGGASNPVTLRLLERDPSTINVTPGPFTFDRKSGNWIEAFTLSYTGSRYLNATAELQFPRLSPGLSIVNSDGNDSGPFMNVALQNGQTTKVLVRFARKGTTPIGYKTVVKFTN